MPILLDLDGSLYNVREREEYCRRNGRLDWDCWFNPGNLNLDRVNDSVLRLIGGTVVYIASGRIRELQYNATIEGLRSLGIRIGGVWLKPLAWRSVREVVFKARVLAYLIRHGIIINNIIDDDNQTLDTLAGVIEDYGFPTPKLWLVRNNEVKKYKPRKPKVGWIKLRDCPKPNILRIIIHNGEYYAYAVDCEDSIRININGIDILEYEDWVSPIINPG